MARSERTQASFVAVALVFALIMMGTTLPTALYPIFQTQLGFSQLMITVIYAVYAVGVMTALVITGNWSDQIGRRPMLLLGLLFSMASALAFMWGGSLWPLLLGRLLSGVSAGIFTGTATVAVVELEPRGRRELATLMATAVNMGGLGVGPLFSGILAYWLPAPLFLPFLLHLLLALVAVVCVWRAPETAQRPAQPRLSVRKPHVPAQVRAVFIPASIAAFAAFAVLGMFTSVMPSFLTDIMGYDNTILTGAIVFGLFVASIGGQVLQARMPRRWRLPLGCLGLIVGSLLVIVSIHLASLWVMIVGGLISGVGHGTAFRAGMGEVAAASPPQQRAAVASSFFLVAYVAISVPVVGLGVLVHVLNLADAGMIFSAIVALLALAAGAGVLLQARRATPA